MEITKKIEDIVWRRMRKLKQNIDYFQEPTEGEVEQVIWDIIEEIPEEEEGVCD